MPSAPSWTDVGELVEELVDHRDVQRGGSGLPLEARLPRDRLRVVAIARPQHPAREHAVEERLHERRAEEVVALLALELQAERLFELAAELVERGQFVAVLEAQARGARVAREEPGDVLGVGQWRVVEQHPAEELGEALAGRVRELAGLADVRPEGAPHCLARLARLERADARAAGVPAHEHEVAQVGDEHEPIALDVTGDLLGCRDGEDIVARCP